MYPFNTLKSKSLPKVKPGKAESIDAFFEKTIAFQFENKAAIKCIHKALIDYIYQEDCSFFIRAYGSYSRDNYHLLRRGFKTIYPDGKSVTFCDNTFSMLFSGMQLANIPFNAKQLKELFNQKHLITSFSQTTPEKELAYYTPKGAVNVNLNTKGWYKAHIKPVGKDYENYDLKAMFPNPNRNEYSSINNLRSQENNLSERELKLLRAHLLRLIHPFNSFLVPKRRLLSYNGSNIGEENNLICHVENYIKTHFAEEYIEFNALSLEAYIPKNQKTISHITWGNIPAEKEPIEIELDETEVPVNKVTIRSNFILSKNLTGKGLTIRFRDINNNLVQYNHDRVLEQLGGRITNLPCWDKYGNYTNSKKLPRFAENLESVKIYKDSAVITKTINSEDIAKNVIKSPIETKIFNNPITRTTMIEAFENYLINEGYSQYTPSGNPSTVYDYCRRVERVCERENISILQLAKKIGFYVDRYDEFGEETAYGNKSNRAVINALKQFESFVNTKD